MKKLTSVVLATLLGVSFTYAADFSKLSTQDFVQQAGKLNPSDVPDYRIETHKRLQKMNYEEGKAFKANIKNARKIADLSRSPQERRDYKVAVCKAMQAKTNTMTGQQIREAGLKVPKKNCDTIQIKFKG